MDVEKENPRMIDIDGGVLEGGGQILRIAAALSAIRGIPIRVYNIRAGRSTPGLRPQHIAGLKLIKDISGGVLIGADIGSTEITFNPGRILGGDYRADPQTAGSIALLMQVSLPVALYADAPVKLMLKGATNADMAPPIDYMQTIFRPLMAQFGGNMKTEIVKRGYYPRGGGEVIVHISPLGHGERLNPVRLLNRGPILRVWGAAYVAGVLPIKVAQAIAGSARDVIRQKLPGAGVSVPLDLISLKEPPGKAVGNGSGMNLFAETGESCLLGTSCIGNPRITPESVGNKAAEQLLEQIHRGSCVDTHAQDQMILLMALASGTSKVCCGELTLHSKTAIHVIELMTKAKFKEYDGILECTGIGQTT